MTFPGLLRNVASLAGAACIAIAAHAQPAALSPRAGDEPVVESFDLEQVAELNPGVALRFSVFGTADAVVTLSIEGGQHLVSLPETAPGIYEGVYLIDGRDRIRGDSRVVATVRRDGRVTQSRLGEPLLLARGTTPWVADRSPGAAARDSTAAPAVETCADCAVVVSIEPDLSSSVGIVGAFTGAVAGMAATHPLGEDHGRRVMGVVGAVTGSWLGREIERRTARPRAWLVVLRLPDGSVRERRVDSAPAFRAGDTVNLSASDVKIRAVAPTL
ncbi:MAG: hypothetical protein ABI745_01065 [Caldimonas sp.]